MFFSQKLLLCSDGESDFLVDIDKRDSSARGSGFDSQVRHSVIGFYYRQSLSSSHGVLIYTRLMYYMGYKHNWRKVGVLSGR